MCTFAQVGKRDNAREVNGGWIGGEPREAQVLVIEFARLGDG